MAVAAIAQDPPSTAAALVLLAGMHGDAPASNDELDDLKDRLSVLATQVEGVASRLSRAPSLEDLLRAATLLAKEENEPDVHAVLEAVWGAVIMQRKVTLRLMADAAARAARLHPALQETATVPDFKAVVERLISCGGPPAGIDATELAGLLVRWLVESNLGEHTPEQSAAHDAYEAEARGDAPPPTIVTDLDRVRAALPSRIVNGGRVFVMRANDGGVAHREMASPRFREKACRCSGCEAGAILRKAEKAMNVDGAAFAFPIPRKRRAAAK